jgi:transposase
MYLDGVVEVPKVAGKITYRTKKGTTYVEYECGRVYHKEKKYTTVTRKTIGKLLDPETKTMQPNDNFLRYFPDTELPEERDRTSRSCALRIGTWIVVRKIINDYKLTEMLGRYLQPKEVGLFLDLAAYSIIEEDNRAQYYPAYAFSHPLFAEGMKIYSDSKVSSFLKSIDEEVSVAFQNDWNGARNHRERIYISYDSTSKHCEAGDLRVVEKGHSKENEETTIFNYAIAYDTKCREPLFYELYPGSINDISQFQCTVDKANGYGYKKIGFVLDRGYFGKENIYHLEENGYSFVMMLKGKADLVQKWVLENKGTFETSRSCNIAAYQTYGKTIERRMFATDTKPRYIHIYHSATREALERVEVEKKINQMTAFLKKHTNEFKEFNPGMDQYFELYYDENAKKPGRKTDDQTNASKKFVFFEERAAVIELELKLCGYFVIITSDKMTAKEALEIYKGRDASEKLFLSDKTFLGNGSLRVGSDESLTNKVFIEFVALIIRNRMYNCLKDAMKEMAKKSNYMTVPAAIRELDKIEMGRQLDGVYRLDHAVTARQKTILAAFGITDTDVKYRADEISKRLEYEEQED